MLFQTAVALVGLILGSIEDIKTREVPDWLNFSLIFIGVGSALIFSISTWDYTYIVNSMVGLIVGIGIGYLMYYTAQWGGGDAKLLMGLGALIGINVFALPKIPIFFTLILNIFIFGAVYGLAWSIVLAIKHRDKFLKSFKKRLYSPHVTKIRKVNLIFCLVLFVGVLTAEPYIKVILFALMVFLYTSLYVWLMVKSIEESCMVKKIPVSKLTEGDWIVKDVKYKGKKIVGPKDLGVSKKQIAEIKKRKIKYVTVKEGVPFVPSFLLGYLATLAWGNWFLPF